MRNYPLIRAWHHMSGSFDYYIQDQVRQAEEEKAPQDAIFRNPRDNTWMRFPDIRNPETKERVASYAAVFGVDSQRLLNENTLHTRAA